MALRAFACALAVWTVSVLPGAGADLQLLRGADTKAEDGVGLTIDVDLMSDYIYRGVSLSARKPSGATSIDAEWHGFYGNANVQSVTLPTSPRAEVTLTGGWQRDFAEFKLDLNANYFWYPGEFLPKGTPATSYWEYALGIERAITDPITLKGLIAYAPNVSGTGAWGAYGEAGAEIKLGQLLRDVTWKFNATAGYWRFGTVSPGLRGFALPSYAHWRVGLEFEFAERLTLGLNYWDTDLSKEDCFVFTGDTMARPGGVADPISNPDGLRSRLCGAALVGTVNWSFDVP